MNPFALLYITFLLTLVSGNSGKGFHQTLTDRAMVLSGESRPEPVTSLPAFSLVDTNGTAIRLQSFQGKKVFVNLWASWCSPCRREMLSIEKLYQSVDTSRVAFLLVALDDDFKRSIAYVRFQKLKLPVYYPAEQLPGIFNVKAIPASFIFDEQGQLIHRIEGSQDYNTEAFRSIFR